MKPVSCPNFNHRKANAPVRGCPNCGGIVNPNVRPQKCGEQEHAHRRKNGDLFCTACCEQLRTP